jgi:hypothetical protein
VAARSAARRTISAPRRWVGYDSADRKNSTFARALGAERIVRRGVMPCQETEIFQVRTEASI